MFKHLNSENFYVMANQMSLDFRLLSQISHLNLVLLNH